MTPANYVICTHPRSGSNYLCELLTSTSLMGSPAEYFHEGNLQKHGLTSHNPEHLRDRYRHVVENTASANGVIGIKLFIFDLPNVHSAGLLEKLRDYSFVFLQRRDKLAQAISIRRALESGKMTSEHSSSLAPVDYDYDDIKLRIVRAIKAEQDWQAFFRDNAITPVLCLYEELAASPQVMVDRIARSIGLSSGAPINPDKLWLRVQRDATSLGWRDRFLAEAAQRDPDLHEFCRARLADPV